MRDDLQWLAHVMSFRVCRGDIPRRFVVFVVGSAEPIHKAGRL